MKPLRPPSEGPQGHILLCGGGCLHVFPGHREGRQFCWECWLDLQEGWPQIEEFLCFLESPQASAANAQKILNAFRIDPDKLPGLGYLSGQNKNNC